MTIAPLPPLDPDMDPEQNHYWSYHSLDTLLGCKKPLTASQDEDLFISVHQVCELAFHQMILDLDRAIRGFENMLHVADGIADTADAVYFLRRINGLWGTVNATMPVLALMRAFAEFRTSIGPTSGFQSAQFRKIEIMSGIRVKYWEGGTADRDGNKHVAETEFDRRYGDELELWFALYRDRSLKTLTDQLTARDSVSSLAAHPGAGPLIKELAAYDQAQLHFHKIHLGMVATQLKKVNVQVGTGGTDFRTYLTKYESTNSPLFPQLAALSA